MLTQKCVNFNHVLIVRICLESADECLTSDRLCTRVSDAGCFFSAQTPGARAQGLIKPHAPLRCRTSGSVPALSALPMIFFCQSLFIDEKNIQTQQWRQHANVRTRQQNRWLRFLHSQKVPADFLLLLSVKRFHHFFRSSVKICPEFYSHWEKNTLQTIGKWQFLLHVQMRVL